LKPAFPAAHSDPTGAREMRWRGAAGKLRVFEISKKAGRGKVYAKVISDDSMATLIPITEEGSISRLNTTLLKT
jgi:hypothetical protein